MLHAVARMLDEISSRVDGRVYGAWLYGSAAMADFQLLLDYVLTFPDGEEDAWSTSYDGENEAAKHLYTSFGFVPNGEKDSNYEDAEDVAVFYPFPDMEPCRARRLRRI